MAMTLRLTEDQAEALRLAAERERKSMHTVAVEAIEAYMDRQNVERDRLLAQIVREDEKLLYRLGTA